uniref:SH3 domain binding kinase family member 3 n=1 Tax=Chrysemys picta bellii TaxID=8478 RepID=A0A8C3FQ79_CHRPI
MELPEVEDNAEFLERLMEVTSRSLPQLELQEQYTIIKELGSGTYGNVLLAEHRERGTALALKLMPKERTERRAFLREYCIALCLSAHAGFLRTLPIVFESPTHFAFAQELAPAGDLCAIGLPEAQVKRCAAQLAEALDFMHGKALVHRDIKLDNVLLFDCECRRVKLGDFGLTRLEGTPVCAMSGTLPYAPPELCLLEASETLELDASLDVWAFGVLLFCLGTGCFPWDVAVSPDPQFEAFGAWQNSTVPGEAPAPWRAFGPAAQEMFRRLLTLDPNRRSPAIEVHKYLPLVWLASSLRELDGAGGLRGQGKRPKHRDCPYKIGTSGHPTPPPLPVLERRGGAAPNIGEAGPPALNIAGARAPQENITRRPWLSGHLVHWVRLQLMLC